MMRRTLPIDEQNPIELSFLDVMSCGMIAAMFLALVFSVIGEVPPRELTSMPYLDMLIEIDQTNSSLGVAFRSELDNEWVILPMEQFDLNRTGQLKESASVWKTRLAPYGSFQLLGFKPYFRSSRSTTSSSESIQMIVHIENPARGQWQFALFRRDPELQGDSPPRIEIRSLAFSTNSSPQLKVVHDGDQEKRFLGSDDPQVFQHSVTTNQVVNDE